MLRIKASDTGILPNNPNTWIPYSSTITKTIYDPCPYGYRIPINGSWAGFPTNTWTIYDITGGTSWPATNGGWWPVAGNRERSSTILYNIGSGGYCWSSSRHSTAANAYYLAFHSTGWVSHSTNDNRSNCFPVRCIEKATSKNEMALSKLFITTLVHQLVNCVFQLLAYRSIVTS